MKRSCRRKSSKKTQCNVCHEPTEKSKKFRNAYGLELSKLLEKNEKDEKKVIEALKKAEEKKSCVEEKTYGDLIKDGKVPATDCKPVEEEDGDGDGDERLRPDPRPEHELSPPPVRTEKPPPATGGGFFRARRAT